MSTILNESQSDTAVGDRSAAGEQLQAETIAVRLRIRWPGVRKTLSEDQKQQAASAFDADSAAFAA